MGLSRNHFNCLSCTTPGCILKTLGEKQLSSLRDESVSMKIPINESLFHHGAPLNHILHLKAGLVKIYNGTNNSKTTNLNLRGAGSFLGIRHSLAGNYYTYSAKSVIDSEICYINKNIFHEMLCANSKFCFQILKKVSEESIMQDRKVQSLRETLLPGKVANALLFFADTIFQREEFELPVSKSDLALFIGASRERVSKTINEFDHDNIISMTGNNIKITSRNLLVQLSQIG